MKIKWILLILSPIIIGMIFLLFGGVLLGNEGLFDKVIDMGLSTYSSTDQTSTEPAEKSLGWMFWFKTVLMVVVGGTFAHYYIKFVKKANKDEDN